MFSSNVPRERYEDDSIDDEHHLHTKGYSGSKWVGEKLMLKGIEKGLPIQIYRLGLVAGDNITGKTPQEQWFTKLLMSCYVLGFYFDSPGFNMDVTPVDYVARSMVKLSSKDDPGSHIFHLLNPRSVSLVEFFKDQKTINKKLKKVSSREWLTTFKEKAAHLELPIISFINFDTDLQKNIQQPSVSCAKTLAILKQETGMEFPDTSDYFSKYLPAAIEEYYSITSTS